MIVVVMMVMLVDGLLLMATAKLLGKEVELFRMLVSICMDVLFTLLSSLVMPELLQHFVCRLVILLLMGLTMFGWSSGVIVFTLLNLSLGRIADRENEILSILLGAAGLGLSCLVLGKRHQYIPVELTCSGQTVTLTALRDTGNTLRDPVTGRQVLIVDADIAKKLLGLSPAMLQDPVTNLTAVHGLRLIPYKTIGNTGFLLATHILQAKIGNKKGSVLVAFSPQIFGSHYQALAGGIA